MKFNRPSLKINLEGHYSGCTLWFTGLPSSGKTTLAMALYQELTKRGIPSYNLDGDVIRRGLNSDLGFSKKDRKENIRRIGEVSKLLANSGIVCISSFISPFKDDRANVKRIHMDSEIPFLEIYLSTPLTVCKERDVKGLYKKAIADEIPDFTGISAPYEIPTSSDLVLNTAESTVSACTQRILCLMQTSGLSAGEGNLTLINKIATNTEERKNELNKPKRSVTEVRLNIDKVDLQWLQVISEGWAAPLKGFMTEDQYLQCLHFKTVSVEGSIHSQSMPIILTCSVEQATQLTNCTSINLIYNGKRVARLLHPECYQLRKEEHCSRVFGSADKGHPYINKIMSGGDWLIGGEVVDCEPVRWKDGLDEYRYTPAQLREIIKNKKADAVFAFQVRNPIHNGHALLIEEARRNLLSDGYKNPVLLLHPLGGWTKSDDVPLSVRIKQHNALLQSLNWSEWTMMAIFPSPMIYAGPVEVQWHVKTRMVAGATHYIVGRDPAGLPHPTAGGDMYEPTHGAKVLQLCPFLRQIVIMPFKVAALNKTTRQMEFVNPDRKDDYEFISGTKMRTLAKQKLDPPAGFMAPAAWEILKNYYANGVAC